MLPEAFKWLISRAVPEIFLTKGELTRRRAQVHV